MKKQTAQQLIRIVAEQMELNQTDKEFGEILNDVSSNGAAAGWPGFTYTSDMKDMFQKHGRTLLKIMEEIVEERADASVDDCRSVESMVRSFYGLKDYEPKDPWLITIHRIFTRADVENVEYDAMIADKVAFFLLEEAANEYFNHPLATFGGDE